MRARLFLALLLSSSAASLQAADLTVRFSGRFQPGTCEIAVDDVDVGTFEAPSFDAINVTPSVPFEIRRSRCASELLTLHISLTGAADASSADYFAIPDSGGVSGLAVRITDITNRVVRPNQPGGNWFTGGSDAGTYPLRAALVKVGTVSAGTIRTPITVQVTYN